MTSGVGQWTSIFASASSPDSHDLSHLLTERAFTAKQVCLGLAIQMHIDDNPRFLAAILVALRGTPANQIADLRSWARDSCRLLRAPYDGHIRGMGHHSLSLRTDSKLNCGQISNLGGAL